MRLFSLCLGALIALTSAGCFAVTDLDRFEQDQGSLGQGGTTGAAPSPYRDLRFTLKNMKPHAKHYFAYRIVSDQNIVVGEGALAPFGPSVQGPNNDPLDTLIEVHHAVPKVGNFHLDFYADLDGSGSYNGIGAIKTNDHAWRITSLNELDPSVGTVTDDAIDITFSHTTNFNDIDEGGAPQLVGLDAHINLVNTSAFYGRVVEVRVIDRANDHTVGIERFTSLDASQTVATVAGMIDPGVDYDIEVYADGNGDSIYQDTDVAGGDSGWRIPVTATDDGLEVTLDMAVGAQPPTRVPYAFP